MIRADSIVSRLQKNSRFKYVAMLCLLVMYPVIARAQMFSVDDSRGPNRLPGVAVLAGFEPIHFEYKGDAGTPGAATYDFSGDAIRFRLETPGINIYLGTAGGLTGLDNFSYLDAGIKFGYAIRLLGNKSVSLQLPLILRSGYTSVSNNDVVFSAAPEFDQGTFEGGAGLNLSAHLAPRFRLSTSLIPGYGFTFSTRTQSGGGSVATLEGQARLYFDDLFGNSGLSLGYDYNLRNFDIEDEVLDYTSTAHSILIGITF